MDENNQTDLPSGDESTPEPQPQKINKNIIIAIVVIVLIIIVGVFAIMDPETRTGTVVVEDDVVEPTEEEIRASIDANVDRNRDVFGIGVHYDVGTFFLHIGTQQTLYALGIDAECDTECMSGFSPYTGITEVDDELLTSTKLGESYHYSWDDKGLYTFNDESEYNSFLGDGTAGVWRIARPY